jgi:hypothetical protein
MHSRNGANPYWIGASDEYCEGKFGWCELDRPLSNWTKLAPVENNDPIENENCLYLDYMAGFLKSDLKTTFRDDRCAVKRTFICEV